MRAFVYQASDRSWSDCGAGQMVTPEYKSLRSMFRYFFNKRLRRGRWVALVHYNWDNRYGKEDLVVRMEVTEKEGCQGYFVSRVS